MKNKGHDIATTSYKVKRASGTCKILLYYINADPAVFSSPPAGPAAAGESRLKEILRRSRSALAACTRTRLFEPNDEVLKGLVRHYVIDAIKRWEKRVVISGVSFDDSDVNKDRNLLPVRISYRVIQSQVEGNLVYPFYREPRQAPPLGQVHAAIGG